MRLLTTLLLLLAMPGLVLPAGFVLRLCQCRAAARSAAASCCDAPSDCSCCRAPSRGENDDAPAAYAKPECKCAVLRGAEREPARLDPARADRLAGPALALASAAPPAPPPVPSDWLALRALNRSPPPPGFPRNLPLRL